MERDMADLLKHLDELIKENKRTLAGFNIRGDKSSREQARQDGQVRGLRVARQAIAEWIRREQYRGNQRLARDRRLSVPCNNFLSGFKRGASARRRNSADVPSCWSCGTKSSCCAGRTSTPAALSDL